MKEVYKRHLDVATGTLCKQVDPDNEIRQLLDCRRILTTNQISSIYNKQLNTTEADRVLAIITFLKYSPDAAYSAFRECIREIGRGDLLDEQGLLPLIDTAEPELSHTNKHPKRIVEFQTIIHPVGSATSSFPERRLACTEMDEKVMTDEHKDNLITNRKKIVANIIMDYIINDLEGKKLVLSRDVQKIKDKIGDEQAEYFLDILPKRPDSAYYTFITLLRNTDQEHLANILEPPKKESSSRVIKRKKKKKEEPDIDTIQNEEPDIDTIQTWIQAESVVNIVQSGTDETDNVVRHSDHSEATGGIFSKHLVTSSSSATGDATKNKDTVDYTIHVKHLTFLDRHPVSNKAVPFGSGAFAKVYRVLHTDKWGSNEVAFKKLSVNYIGEFSPEDQRLIWDLKYEAKIHQQLNHPNIVSMFGMVFEELNYGIILEYVCFGSWISFKDRFVKKEFEESAIPWILKTNMACEISFGMLHLHNLSPPIIHCDIKAQNILIGKHLIAKISDFGISKWRDFHRTHTSEIIRGTCSYIPPENFEDDELQPSFKYDVYSFSILFWEMLCEKQAYKGLERMIPVNVPRGKRPPLKDIPKDVPKEIIELIVTCWHQEPDKRLNFTDLNEKMRQFFNKENRGNELDDARSHVLNLLRKKSASVINSVDSELKKEMQQDFVDSRSSTEIKQNYGNTEHGAGITQDSVDTVYGAGIKQGAIDTDHRAGIKQDSIDTVHGAGIKQGAIDTEHGAGIKQVSVDTVHGAGIKQGTIDTEHGAGIKQGAIDTEHGAGIKQGAIDSEHGKEIRRVFQKLCEDIKRPDQIILSLLLKGALTFQESNSIGANHTTFELTESLLNVLISKPAAVYYCFLEALDETNQRWVYYLLKNKDTTGRATEAANASTTSMSFAATRYHSTINDLVPFTSITFLDEKPISSGAFGAVYKALHKEWGCQVAYKRLAVLYIGERSKVEQQLVRSLKNEADIHLQLHHPNIVSMLGLVFENGNYGVILEFVTYGSWIDFIHSIKDDESAISIIPSILKTKLSVEISSGMSYLHSVNIIHCDLKLQNVLIGEQINAKISDFGLSKWKDYSRSHTSAGMTQGTPSHISPEQWKDMNCPPSDKTDVYSFGILLWEMFTEKEAYKGRRGTIREWVIGGQRLPLGSIPRDVTKEIHSQIEACWDQECNNRPSFSELAGSLNSFVHGRGREAQIRESKELVLNTYYRRSSGSVDVANNADGDHVQKIRRVHQTLCGSLRHPDEILTSLFEKRAVTQQEQESIQSQTNLYQSTNHLLDVLSAKPASAYKCFLEALDATQQHHLHLLLDNIDYKLNVKHKDILRDNFTYLKDNITFTDSALLDILLQAAVLDPQEVADVRSKVTDRKGTDQLLQYILRSSYEQYQQFLEALNESKHQHVFNRLTAKEQGINTVSSSSAHVQPVQTDGRVEQDDADDSDGCTPETVSEKAEQRATKYVSSSSTHVQLYWRVEQDDAMDNEESSETDSEKYEH